MFRKKERLNIELQDERFGKKSLNEQVKYRVGANLKDEKKKR